MRKKKSHKAKNYLERKYNNINLVVMNQRKNKTVVSEGLNSLKTRKCCIIFISRVRFIAIRIQGI